MKKIFNSMLNAIFPQRLYCLCCGDLISQNLEYELCSSCIGKLQWIAENPFKNQLEGFSFHDVLSLVYYDIHAKTMIHDLKFHEKTYMARPMGALMGDLYLDQVGEEALFLPVPMHEERLAERGYNQAALLCQAAAEKTGMDYMEDVLIKGIPTKSQRESSAFERRSSLVGAIFVNPERLEEIKGRALVLVDDVITTGSTAECCSRVLMEAGARSVTVLTFAAV